MRQEEIDAIGNRLFALLVSLLRPLGRSYAAPGAEPEPEPAPAQRVELFAGWRGERMWFDLQHWLRCRPAPAQVFSWLLPLPPDSAVHEMEVQCSADAARADLRERREARDFYEQARRSGRVSALLTEDAPGFFGLEITSSGCAAVHLRLRGTCPVPGSASARGGELAVHCEARPVDSDEAQAPRRAHLIRLGSGHVLDTLVGVHRETRSRLVALELSKAGGEAAAASPADVLAARDGSDGASAMFRGWLAGRPVRLWAKLGEALTEASAGTDRCGEIRTLMAEYRQCERSEAERRGLAARVAELGLEAGVATLWTSLVAVAGHGGLNGERVASRAA